MSLPPLLLYSEYNDRVNLSGTQSAAAILRIRNMIVGASDYIQNTCQRRFDERIETRRYNCFHERTGGALLDFLTLQLDDDLKSASLVTNGNGATIDASLYKLIRSGNSRIGVSYYSQVRILYSSGIIWQSGSNDPYESIQVTGIWGYGGDWADTTTRLNGAVSIGDQTITVADGTKLEIGMTLKIESEYMLITDLAGPLATVTRGINGSTEANHASLLGVLFFKAISSIKNLVTRLVQWANVQVQNPLAGSMTIGDFSFPVNTSGIPSDIYLGIRDLGLLRSGTALGV